MFTKMNRIFYTVLTLVSPLLWQRGADCGSTEGSTKIECSMNLLGTAAAIFLIILNIVVIVSSSDIILNGDNNTDRKMQSLMYCVIQLLGLGLLIIGALIYQKSGLVNDDISPVLNAITGGDFTLSDLIKIIAVVIIVIGVFTFLVSGSGIVGACGKNRPVLVVVCISKLCTMVLSPKSTRRLSCVCWLYNYSKSTDFK